MISMKDCFIPNDDFTPRYQSYRRSRFPAGLYQTYRNGFKTHLKTELLSPLITYTVNLVFRGYYPIEECIDFKYRLKGETTTSTVNLANRRIADYFDIAELCQFNSDGSIVDIEIDFEAHGTNILVEGISFDPLEKVEDQESKEDQVSKKDKVEVQVLEEYQEIVEVASLFYTSLEELKQILRIGIHLKEYKTKVERSEMIAMKDCLIPNEDFTPRYQSHRYSRFPACFNDTEQKGFRTHVNTQLMKPLIPYTVNLAFYHSASHRQTPNIRRPQIQNKWGDKNFYLYR
ncbi:hypothetical protein Tco_0457973 [Tanacetum coccineum]